MVETVVVAVQAAAAVKASVEVFSWVVVMVVVVQDGSRIGRLGDSYGEMREDGGVVRESVVVWLGGS